jgi:hypothetical protein
MISTGDPSAVTSAEADPGGVALAIRERLRFSLNGEPPD